MLFFLKLTDLVVFISISVVLKGDILFCVRENRRIMIGLVGGKNIYIMYRKGWEFKFFKKKLGRILFY